MKQSFRRMFDKEKKEHPTLKAETIKTIVKDHLKEIRRKK